VEFYVFWGLGMSVKVPRLLMGTSPFIGAGQFGVRAFKYYMTFYMQPENMVRLFIKSFEFGVKAVQLLADKTIKALIEASKRSNVKPFVVYSTDFTDDRLIARIKTLEPLEPEVVAIHAEIADRRNLDVVSKNVKILEDFGITPGLATHQPGITLKWVENENVPVEVVLAPLNKIGYAMDPDFNESLEAIKSCSRTVIAIKPLAAGKIKPLEAFEFVYKYVDSVAVGVTSEEEMHETYNAAFEAYKKIKGTSL
jgi:hypothetical protein